MVVGGGVTGVEVEVLTVVLTVGPGTEVEPVVASDKYDRRLLTLIPEICERPASTVTRSGNVMSNLAGSRFLSELVACELFDFFSEPVARDSFDGLLTPRKNSQSWRSLKRW